MSNLAAALLPLRRAVPGLVVLSAAGNLLVLAGPLFMLQVQDRVLASGSMPTLTVLFAIILYLYALMAGIDLLRGRVLARIGAGVQSSLDGRMFDATLRQVERASARARPVTGPADLAAIRAAITSPVTSALFDLPWTLGFVAILFLFHPLLGWFSLASAVAVILLSLLAERSSRAAQTKAAHLTSEADALAEQTRTAIDALRVLGMAPRATALWLEKRANASSAILQATDRSGAFGAGLRAFRLLLQSTILALGAALVLVGQLSPGAMIAASILLGRALQPVEALTGGWPLLQRARQAKTELERLLTAHPELPTPMALPRPEARLSVKGLIVVPPGESEPVLQGISFDAVAGDAIVIIGPSASGKTSLIRALVGLWSPLRGEVRLGGAELAHYGRDGLAAHLGYLPQEVVLFPGSVAHNVGRLAPEPDPQAVITAARMSGAHDLILGLPQGYDTEVLAGGARLSGGQRQRIGLARAFYGNPVLLVLDEPDAGLDEAGLRALNGAIIAARAAGQIVLVASHRPAILKVCNKAMMIEGGRLRAFGPKDEVLAQVALSTPGNVVSVPQRKKAHGHA